MLFVKLPDLSLVACRIDREGIRTEKCIVVCQSSREFVTGAAPLSPFGWHFSHFSQCRSLTTDVAPQLKDRKVQLEHRGETRVLQSKTYRKACKSGRSMSLAETYCQLHLWWSAFLLPSKCHASPSEGRCKTTEE